MARLKAGHAGEKNSSSSSARLRAAFTARFISCASPSSAISTASAAAVVPPGLVTASRRADAGDLSAANNAPAPATVARANFSAWARGKPSAMPASVRASAIRNR